MRNSGSGEPLRPTQHEHSVRVSSRAKRARLVMTLQGLEVVVPPGFNQRRIPELVESKRAWIERTAEKIGSRRRRSAREASGLPDVVVLAAVDERWKVEYGTAGAVNRSCLTVREKPGWRLVVAGDTSDEVACQEALRRWLRRRAKRELPARLAGWARRSGLDYERVTIRQQRTRWGSCSQRGSISLSPS